MKESIISAVRLAEAAFGVHDEEQKMVVARNGSVIEIHPENFGWIWPITYHSAREAQKVERRLRKLPDETLRRLHREADESIRFKAGLAEFDALSVELVQRIYGR